jgi:hypothetical protein
MYISRYFVLRVLLLVLLVVDCHLSKLNGFGMSSGLLRSELMEASPIKMVSVKLRLLSMNVGNISFFLTFLLNLAVNVRLERDTTTAQPAFNFLSK